MDTTVIRVIYPYQVTSVDILCGRDKICYNHAANRRFRFLMALNLERYRDTESRKAKSLVVRSLYNQIGEAGGRFLNKERQYNFFTLVSDKVAREKISHALRDKFPRSVLQKIKAELCRSLSFGKCIERAFIIANARLLAVNLPQAQHASDDHVNHILMVELENMLVYRQEAATSIIRPTTSIRISSPILDTQQKSNPVSFAKQYDSALLNKSQHYEAVFWKTSRMGSSTVVYNGEATPQVCAATATTFELDLIRSYSSQIGKIERPKVHLDDTSDVEEIGDFDFGEDLPQTFTEQDCEELVNMLDLTTGL